MKTGNLFKDKAAKDMAVAQGRIPIIDIGPYLRDESGAIELLAKKLKSACEQIGFFYIVNHGIPEDVIEKAFE